MTTDEINPTNSSLELLSNNSNAEEIDWARQAYERLKKQQEEKKS